MSTNAPQAPQAGGCPEPEVLAAFVDGMLGTDERARVESHLIACAGCREVVADAVAVLGEMGGGALARRHSRRTLWLGTAVVLAAAAAVIIAVRLPRPPAYYVPEMAELVAVRADRRPLEPRLTQGFRYAPPAPVTRGPAGDRNLELTATAERVRQQVSDRAGATVEAARGVTYLLSGDPARAAVALQAATQSGAATPGMFSDLAAAYLQRGTTDDLRRGLDAATRAVSLNPELREAAFNRALALERLGRSVEAIQAWRDYAARELDPDWRAEAQRHIAGLGGR